MAHPVLTFTDRGIYCPAGDFHIDPWRPVDRALITHGHSDHARPGHARYLSTPAAALNINELAEKERQLVQTFLSTGELPERISEQFINAVRDALRGLEKVTLDAPDFLRALTQPGIRAPNRLGNIILHCILCGRIGIGLMLNDRYLVIIYKLHQLRIGNPLIRLGRYFVLFFIIDLDVPVL